MGQGFHLGTHGSAMLLAIFQLFVMGTGLCLVNCHTAEMSKMRACSF